MYPRVIKEANGLVLMMMVKPSGALVSILHMLFPLKIMQPGCTEVSTSILLLQVENNHLARFLL